MKISKKDALLWFRFFAQMNEEEEPLLPRQQELAYAVFSQIEEAEAVRIAALQAEIPHLQSLQGRTYFVGNGKRFPMGCRCCLMGNGLNAIRKTNRCNLRCPFCYDWGELDAQPPIGEGLWEIGGCKYRIEDLPLLLSIDRKPAGVSYVYLEPLMEVEKYPEIIRVFREAGVHQHMYTNGTLATRDTLRLLADAGLDELRFNLGATDCADRVIEAMAVAKEYIPQVGIETPMTPSFYKAFEEKKRKILRTGIDFINCAELHLNPNNLGNYMGEPLYIHRLGYVSPIWSHELTCKLMKTASLEDWDITVHDCCNHTKFARDINLKAHEGGWFGASSYECEFDPLPYEAFLPILEDDSFPFLTEEPLPEGFRPGDIVL